jgi:hypothetical protein
MISEENYKVVLAYVTKMECVKKKEEELRIRVSFYVSS